jgi:hypothetical protein
MPLPLLWRLIAQGRLIAGAAMEHFGWAWVAFALALGVHVADEAAHDFLSVYNPKVKAIRARLPFLPLPVFTFGRWLGGLIAGIVLLLALSPLAFEGNAVLHWIAWPLAILVGIGNGALHLLGSGWYRRIMPGTYSAPLMILAGLWLLGAAL